MIRIAVVAEFPLGVLTGQMMGRGGGQAATWLPQLAKAWEAATDCDIHWCVLDRTAAAASTVSKWRQTFHRIPSPGISIGLLLGRWPQRLAFRKTILEIRPDVVHCWGTETLNGAALWEFSGPTILSMQGVVTAYMRTGDLGGWRWSLFKHWESRSIRRATVVTSESQWGLDRVEEIEPGKCTHKLEYGVFPSFYDIDWFPDPNRPRIFFAGGLNRLKGVDILLEMLRRNRRRNWKMVFAGSGYLEGPLRELNDPNVELLGTLKTDEVQAQMAKAWALALPSRADTSPNVVKEARVIGLPVIGSPNGGHAEYIQDGVDGKIVSSEDPDAWFQAINSLACDLDQCRAMGSIHLEYYRAHFRPENTATQFLELYRQVNVIKCAKL